MPIGTVDRPREQRRDTMTSTCRRGGHAAVVGGPRSGKSTLLRTIVTSLALTTTPGVQFYVLDFGGGTFAPLAGLPHVAGVGAVEPDVVRRIVVTGIVDRREAYFRAHGIDSIETYRSRAGPGPGPTTGTATSSSSSTAGARCAPTSTTSSCTCSSWPGAA